jgi:hypothetical protein
MVQKASFLSFSIFTTQKSLSRTTLHQAWFIEKSEEQRMKFRGLCGKT